MVDIPIKSLYLHYPFCKNLCNYCDFYKGQPTPELESDYEELLVKMFERHDELMKEFTYSWADLETFYIGGGTPSLWGTRGVNLLSQEFKKRNIVLSHNCEFTLEVNPGDWTSEGIDAWRDFGVSRFSTGSQSLNPNFLKLLDRVHDVDDVFETLKYFSSINVDYSVDFMLGLPFSEKYKRDVIEELEEILKYNPTHISLYILTVKDNYKYYDDLPSEEYIEKEYLSVSEYLKSQGFLHYEVSNFAKPNKESIHNLRYWQMETVAAIGPSATGFLAEKKYRYKWKTKSHQYVSEQLSDVEYLIERIYVSLRINEGIALDFFNQEKLTELGKKWQERDLAILKDDKIILTSKGYLLLDSLMDEVFITFKEKF